MPVPDLGNEHLAQQALARTANLPPGFGADTQVVPEHDLNYRYGQWQDGRVSLWVVDCPQCSRDDEGWMIRFDPALKRMVRCTWRTKAAADRACNEHFNGNHDDRGDQP